jgi:peptidoglycan/xylan/chitin deacetylase (PgdA/CDA1 family)
MENGFVTLYQDIKEIKPTTLRGTLRDMVLTGLSLGVNPAVFKKPRVQFLYIHHIFKDEEAAFRKLLDFLQKDHTFISYTDAINKIVSGTVDKPYIAFSSDDGLKNNLKAAEILNEYNAKACFFINPGIIGETNSTTVKNYCYDTLQFYPVEFLTWDEIAKMQQQGHEIGNHTMLHMNVAQASEQEIRDDLSKSLQILRKQCGDVGHFAFPFGRFFHFSKTGRKVVFETGHTSCATAERGCHINPATPITKEELCIRRDHVVLGWDMRHILYFLANSAKQVTTQNNYYPESFK